MSRPNSIFRVIGPMAMFLALLSLVASRVGGSHAAAMSLAVVLFTVGGQGVLVGFREQVVGFVRSRGMSEPTPTCLPVSCLQLRVNLRTAV